MAISQATGTEIVRTVHLRLDAADTADKYLIYGEQHHIYTVLNITAWARSAATTGLFVWIQGYESADGTADNSSKTAQQIGLFRWLSGGLYDTYVWNDKFSFNGFEPTDFGAGLDATKQTAIAAQGSSVAQKLIATKLHNSDQFDVSCTFIDQNNS